MVVMYIERMSALVIARLITDVEPIIFQTEISSWCRKRLRFPIEIMARSTLTGSKVDERTKSLNRNRLHGESLAIYNGIPRNWHTLWKITRTRKNRESD